MSFILLLHCGCLWSFFLKKKKVFELLVPLYSPFTFWFAPNKPKEIKTWEGKIIPKEREIYYQQAADWQLHRLSAPVTAIKSHTFDLASHRSASHFSLNQNMKRSWVKDFDSKIYSLICFFFLFKKKLRWHVIRCGKKIIFYFGCLPC